MVRLVYLLWQWKPSFHLYKLQSYFLTLTWSISMWKGIIWRESINNTESSWGQEHVKGIGMLDANGSSTFWPPWLNLIGNYALLKSRFWPQLDSSYIRESTWQKGYEHWFFERISSSIILLKIWTKTLKNRVSLKMDGAFMNCRMLLVKRIIDAIVSDCILLCNYSF